MDGGGLYAMATSHVDGSVVYTCSVELGSALCSFASEYRAKQFEARHSKCYKVLHKPFLKKDTKLGH